MKRAIIYSKQYCPYCAKAKDTMHKEGIEYLEIEVSDNVEKLEEMKKISGRSTVPQIFLAIGGCDDFHAFLENGSLKEILNQSLEES